MTVINAYEQLLAEGYLESRSGAGTFVAEHLPEEFLNTPKIQLQTISAELSPCDLKLSADGKNSLTRWTRGGLILGYTAINEEQIKSGVRQLAKAFDSLDKS